MQQALRYAGFLIEDHQGPLDLSLPRTQSEVQLQADCDCRPHMCLAEVGGWPGLWSRPLLCVHGPRAARRAVLRVPPATGPQRFVQVLGARCVSEFRIFHVSERELSAVCITEPNTAVGFGQHSVTKRIHISAMKGMTRHPGSLTVKKLTSFQTRFSNHMGSGQVRRSYRMS